MAFDVKIKVVGLGGSGSNTVSRMKRLGFPKVDLIAINTDSQDLKKKNADFKLRIGRNLTHGLGSGMNPVIGRRAAEEQKEEIKALLSGADIIFITTGLGGGTGSGASAVVADIAKGSGALTIGVVTLPFSFEGGARAEIAKGITEVVHKATQIPQEYIWVVFEPMPQESWSVGGTLVSEKK